MNIVVLGSTGSIGRNTLEVVARLPERFRVVGLAAGRNLKLLAEQVDRFQPEVAAVTDRHGAEQLERMCGRNGLRITWGTEGLEEAARWPSARTVVSAVPGIDGLRPTLAAAEEGRRIALANKESMVVGGFLLKRTAALSGAEILPVDSEHSAIFQCLAKERRRDLRRVILTASGGPFFRLSAEEMRGKTPEEALDHPNWSMGRKVSIDSASLMNKGLELLEARDLFDLTPDQLEVLIHPQSIVHSMVEMTDGSVLAQMSVTDMKIPIQFALTYPERDRSGLPALDLSRIGVLEFEPPDLKRFPLLGLAFKALKEERGFAVVLNAANEEAVEGFLDGSLRFLEIGDVVTETVEQIGGGSVETLDNIFTVDRAARTLTRKLIRQRK